ncbi:hypothetical protein IL306_009001 [Fusarium sp. DS 682]|nr:hypothetical protein IL306_009001 [Fusarium sp. DS 682]
MASIPDIRIRTISYYLEKSRSPRQASNNFTNALKAVAKNTSDLSSLLIEITQNCNSETQIHREARREQGRVRSGYWSTHFQKTASNSQWLTDQWVGPGWLPDDIRAAYEKFFYNSEPSWFIPDLVTLTKAAQAKEIDLHGLWADNGPLRVAIKKSKSQYLTAEAATSVTEKIQDGTIRAVSRFAYNSHLDSITVDLGKEGGKTIDKDGTIAGNSGPKEPRQTAAGPSQKTPVTNGDSSHPAPLTTSASPSHSAHMQAQSALLTNSVRDVLPPTTKKRTFEQMKDPEASTYRKYEALISNLNSERIEKLRAKAIENLSKAEFDKANSDYALGDFKGRESQIKQIRDHSKNLIDNMSNGLREQGSHGQLAGVLANTGAAYFDGIKTLLDSLLQTSPGSEDENVAEELQARHSKTIETLDKAKKRVRALDHIQTARLMHEKYSEMKDYRQKIRALLSETDDRAEELEKACFAAFSHAEEED